MRRRPRLDNNHHEVVEALRKAGALVKSLAGLGDDTPDLLVCANGRLVLMEVKSADGELSTGQLAFKANWPVFVVRSGVEALAVLRRL